MVSEKRFAMGSFRFVRDRAGRSGAAGTVGALLLCAWIPCAVGCGTTGTSTGANGGGTPPAPTDASPQSSIDAATDALGEAEGTGDDGSATGANPGDAAGGEFGDGGAEGGGSIAAEGGTTDGEGGTPPVCDGGAGDATSCFSTGDWSIDNLEPCFITTMDSMGDPITTAYASTPGNPVQCGLDPNSGAPIVPATWSTDSLEVDCSGVFALCYTLKAGDGTNPQAGDCVVAQTCTAAHYGPAGSTMAFPALPGWSSSPDQSACTAAFVATGGYGEMSVTGQTDACQNVQRVFQTVVYCPTACGGPDAPSQCATCMAGGGGPF
jgi:hypothetical protein